MRRSKYEFAELTGNVYKESEKDSVSFAPFGDYPDEEDYGERHFPSVHEALQTLGQEGWFMGGMTPTDDFPTRTDVYIIMQRMIS